MSIEQWYKSLEGSLSKRDARLLNKASRILVNNVVPSKAENLWEPLRGICPSIQFFRGIWNWDSAFHAMAVSRWDISLAREQAEIFFRFQKDNGMFPDVLFEKNQVIEDRFGKPPVWAWAVELLDRREADDAFLEKAYPHLIRNESFWDTSRFRAEDGLFVYGAETVGEERDLHLGFESGWDNSVRWDDGLDQIYPIDLNCFMVGYYRSMVYLADRLGRADDSAIFRHRAAELTRIVLDRFWDPVDQCFYDFDFVRDDFVRVLTPASFMPLWVGVASPEQAAAMNCFASDPGRLYPSMPSVSFDNPKMEHDGYWRGSVWLNVAYFAAKGLYDYGFRETALGIRECLLSWMDQDNSIHENYDQQTGAPLRAPDFSWSSAFAIEFILEMESP